MVAHREFVVGEVEGRLAAFFAFELGIADLVSLLESIEEVPEGFPQVHEGSLHNALGHLIGPRVLVCTQGVELLFEREGGRLCSSLVLPLPLLQSPVEHEPAGASGPGKVIGLIGGRVQADFVCADHEQASPVGFSR